MSLRSAFSFPPPLCPLSNFALLLRYVVDIPWNFSRGSFRHHRSILKVRFAHQCQSCSSLRLAFQKFANDALQTFWVDMHYIDELILRN